MFKRFKKEENLDVEVVDVVQEDNLPDIRSIDVRDLKQHLVEEFDNHKKMKDLIDAQNNEIEELKEKEKELSVALLLIDEYRDRLVVYDADFEKLHSKFHDAKEEINKYKEKMTDLTFQYRKIQSTENEIRNEIKNDIINDISDLLISNVDMHKGNLSKSIMKHYINQQRDWKTSTDGFYNEELVDLK